MGLIINSVVKNISKKVSDTMSTIKIPAFDKLMTAMDEMTREKMHKFMEQSADHSRLYVDDLKEAPMNSFRARNERGEMKYEILKGTRRGKTVYSIHSLVGRELGYVKELKPIIESVTAPDEAHRKYEIFLGEEKIAEVKAKGTDPRKILLAFDGKNMSGDAQGMEFWVLNEKKECMMIASRRACAEDEEERFLLETADPKNEPTCLLVAVAVNLAG